MKKLLLGGTVVAALLVAGPGMAADMKPAPVYTKAPMMAPLYDWTGFYIGGRGVYSWTHTDSTTTNIPTGVVFAPTSEDTSAAHGGGQIGFDYMTSSRIVFGVVADVISGSSNTTTTSNAAGTLVSTTEGKTDASGSVRGRVGYAFDTLLLYGTGGWAWSTGSSTRTQVVGTVNLATPGTAETVSTSHSGWTAGAGLDYAFAPNWDVFAEYRYTNFQALTVTHPLAGRSTNSTSTANSIAAGLNYRFNWGMAKY